MQFYSLVISTYRVGIFFLRGTCSHSTWPFCTSAAFWLFLILSVHPRLPCHILPNSREHRCTQPLLQWRKVINSPQDSFRFKVISKLLITNQEFGILSSASKSSRQSYSLLTIAHVHCRHHFRYPREPWHCASRAAPLTSGTRQPSTPWDLLCPLNHPSVSFKDMY